MRTHEVLVREPDAVNLHVRFDEGEVQTEHGVASEAPADERAGKLIGYTYPTAALPYSTLFDVALSVWQRTQALLNAEAVPASALSAKASAWHGDFRADAAESCTAG